MTCPLEIVVFAVTSLTILMPDFVSTAETPFVGTTVADGKITGIVATTVKRKISHDRAEDRGEA